MADTPQYEDQVLRRVFAVALRDQDVDSTASPPVICLQSLAQVRTAELLLCFRDVPHVSR